MTTPAAAPNLQIPASSSTVDVRVIDTHTDVYLRSGLFWEPELPGFDGLTGPIYCFLVTHRSSGRHILFDLGTRPDWENYAPRIVKLIRATTTVTPGTDVAAVLDADVSGLGVRSADIDAVVWSHNHFDHIGDPSRFPPSTRLVVGPGVKAASWPGWPADPDSGVLESDAAGRTVEEVAFHGDRSLKIGRFDACDYFGDGSFYLLDAPGHALGHICALARTTADPPSYVFMGADACHHPGVLRPSQYLPLPTRPGCPAGEEGKTPAERSSPAEAGPALPACGGCPGELLEKLGRWQAPGEPFFTVARTPLFPDQPASRDTVSKIQELDASDEVLVLIAHDSSLRGQIRMFPDRINDWRAEGVAESTRWRFCDDLKHVRLGEGKGS